MNNFLKNAWRFSWNFDSTILYEIFIVLIIFI